MAVAAVPAADAGAADAGEAVSAQAHPRTAAAAAVLAEGARARAPLQSALILVSMTSGGLAEHFDPQFRA